MSNSILTTHKLTIGYKTSRKTVRCVALSEGVEFDVASGEFHLHFPYKGEINVMGEGIAVTWTIRALKRAGFQVNQKKNGLTVKVITQSKQFLWKITNSQTVYTYHSLYELIKFLNYL